MRQCLMQLTYEVDARRRKLLFINVGKYFSAFPVIWLGGFQAMRHHVGARYVSWGMGFFLTSPTSSWSMEVKVEVCTYMYHGCY